MPNATHLLRHAIQMLIHEPAATVRVTLPALIMIMGSALAAAMIAPDTIKQLGSAAETMEMPDGSGMLTLFVLLIVGLIGYALMAILWHRYVLLNGSEHAEPLRPDGQIIRHYIWCAIVVGIVQFLAAFPITFLMGLLGAIFVALSPMLSLTIVSVFGGIIFAWVALRISIILPAASLGKRMFIGESWAASAPLSSALWGVAAVLAVINVGMSLFTSTVVPEGVTAQLLIGAAIYVVEGLIFVSVMTTLYGHLIEHRALN